MNAIDTHFSPAEAIKMARELVANHSVHYAPLTCRDIIEGLLAGIDSSTCFRKALQTGQESFTLRQQDKCAPAAIRLWANLARSNGCPADRTSDALSIAARWERFPAAKYPD